MYKTHIFPKLCNKLIVSRANTDVIWDIANRLIVKFGPEIRFFDDLLYSILMFKRYRYDERFDVFSKFVDVIDPDRTRPHLAFPILACCPSLMDKQQTLFRFTLLGYNDMSKSDAWAMVNIFYKPMLENLAHNRRLLDVEKLNQMSRTMETFGIKRAQTWKIFYDWAKAVNDNKWHFSLPVGIKHFKEWLKEESEILSTADADLIEDKSLKLTYGLFKRLLNSRDVERVHAFLVRKGEFPNEMKFKEDLDELLALYLEEANWGYVKKLLQLL